MESGEACVWSLIPAVAEGITWITKSVEIGAGGGVVGSGLVGVGAGAGVLVLN